MQKPYQNFTFCTPEKLLQKLRYIAQYECRSTGSAIRILIRNRVVQFEKEHGEIL